MTATTPELTDELEVEYVLWEAEDPFSRPCEREGFECPNVAVYRITWGPHPDVDPTDQDYCCNVARLCLGCFHALSTPPNGLVYCGRCDFESGGDFKSRRYKKIKWSEPLSGG